MNFRMEVSKRGPAVPRRAKQKRVYLGFTNVRTMRTQREVKNRKLKTSGEEKMEYWIQIMRDRGLYAMIMSEVRRDGSGEEKGSGHGWFFFFPAIFSTQDRSFVPV